MNRLRGWIGEKKTALYLWLSLNRKTYNVFHNIILPSTNGTTQIDHLIISEYGIFIVETKNKKGWIFGSENQAKWTQTLYKRKYAFQNPLRQTYRQKIILCEFLKIEKYKVHTVVFFVGDCKFKTKLPNNVLKSRVGRYIKGFRRQILPTETVSRITESLKIYRSESKFSNRDHRQSLKKRHGSITTCPRCGSKLVERTAKKGPNAGLKFLGCENYPKCKMTKKL